MVRPVRKHEEVISVGEWLLKSLTVGALVCIAMEIADLRHAVIDLMNELHRIAKEAGLWRD